MEPFFFILETYKPKVRLISESLHSIEPPFYRNLWSQELAASLHKESSLIEFFIDVLRGAV